MKDLFIPYNLAVKLEDLGFDEPCFGWYDLKQENYIPEIRYDFEVMEDFDIKAPLWQQAFSFLLRKLKNRELYAALESDGEVTLWEVVTEDSYETSNKILASGNKESLEKLIELCKIN